MLSTHASEKKTLKSGRQVNSFSLLLVTLKIEEFQRIPSKMCSDTVLCHVFGYTKAVYCLIILHSPLKIQICHSNLARQLKFKKRKKKDKDNILSEECSVKSQPPGVSQAPNGTLKL